MTLVESGSIGRLSTTRSSPSMRRIWQQWSTMSPLWAIARSYLWSSSAKMPLLSWMRATDLLARNHALSLGQLDLQSGRWTNGSNVFTAPDSFFGMQVYTRQFAVDHKDGLHCVFVTNVMQKFWVACHDKVRSMVDKRREFLSDRAHAIRRPIRGAFPSQWLEFPPPKAKRRCRWRSWRLCDAEQDCDAPLNR